MSKDLLATLNMAEKKKELQKLLKKDLPRGKPLTVAFIGTVGAGKSSFINSIATAMSDKRWREHALSGHHGGDGEPVTSYIKMYPQCCREDEHQNALFPTLLDIGGLPNESDGTWPQILELIFGGRVPDKTKLMDVYDYLETRHDIRESRYEMVNQQMVVDRVVVVSSAHAPVPENLLKAVVKAARPKGGSNTRDIPIFGVMTKYDLIDQDNQDEFIEREQSFKSILGLIGAETRYLLCKNYCGDTDPENTRIRECIPSLDVPILKLMTQICDPVIEVVEQGALDSHKGWIFGYLGRWPYLVIDLLFLFLKLLLFLFLVLFALFLSVSDRFFSCLIEH